MLLVGVLHGAPSSSDDVARALNLTAGGGDGAPRQPPLLPASAVMIELCPPRWRSIAREMAAETSGRPPPDVAADLAAIRRGVRTTRAGGASIPSAAVFGALG